MREYSTIAITKDDPTLPCAWCKCFVANDELLDFAHPHTDRSQFNNLTLEEMQRIYPGAEIVNYNDFKAAKAARQDAEPREWKEVTKERYMDMLEVLPPAAMRRWAFLVGEPYDHHAGTGRPRFACFKREGGNHYELSCHITHAEFCQMFGQTSYDYIE